MRDLQRVIGDEARAQALEQAGLLPDRVVACVGGGSNAIGTFSAFLADEEVELVGVEAGARESSGGTAPRWSRAARACCMAPVVRASGRGWPDHRGPLGLGRPRLSGRGPEHAPADSGRVRYESVTDEEALAAFRELSRLEGIIPALEPAHAIAWVLHEPGARASRS